MVLLALNAPPIKDFVFRDSSLGFVLADLHPLLHQFSNWFKEMMDEREVASKVRSSELEMGWSSGDDPNEAGGDTTASGPSSSGRKEIKPFYALREDCALDFNTFFRFREKF